MKGKSGKKRCRALKLNEQAACTFETLELLENSVHNDTKKALVYIAGYVQKSDEDQPDDTFHYYRKFGAYTDTISRGGLKMPTDSACQWVMFSYTLFSVVKDDVGRHSLINLLMDISTHYGFEMNQIHCRRLSNILINNFCKEMTPRSGKEPAFKVLTLREQ